MLSGLIPQCLAPATRAGEWEALKSCTLLMWQQYLILNRIKYVSNK